MRFVAILAIGFFSIAGVAQCDAGDDDKSDARIYHVPYKITPVYHLLVRAKVNGGGPLNFIIDTGCNVVIMTPDGLRQAGTALKYGRLERIEFEGGAVVENNRCNVNVPAQVSLLNRNNSEGAPLHGVIGMDILKRFKIDLDYANHKMTWTPKEFVKDVEPDEKATAVPLEMTKTDHVVVSVKLNGKGPYRFLYDTGAPATIVSPRLMPAGPAVIDTLEVGSLVAKKAPVIVMKGANFDGVDGVIGFPFIARYRTSMNFPKRTLLVEPGTYEPPHVPMSVVNGAPAKLIEPKGQPLGIVFSDERDKKAGLAIDTVVPDSLAAETGLKAGDRLLMIDDFWIDVPTDCRWIMNRVKPHSTIALKIRRDGKDEVLKFKVKEPPAKESSKGPPSQDATSVSAASAQFCDPLRLARVDRIP